MRRFDKKKIIREANLRLEQNRLFEMMNLNEVADSKGYPYEVLSNWGGLGRKVGFKVPKDENEITDESPSKEWDMFVSISVKSNGYGGFDSDFETLIKKIGYEGESLPTNIFGIYITFGVFKDDNRNDVSFPELNTRRVFSIMGTVKSAVLEVIEENINNGKELAIVYSYPMSGGKKDSELREKLYNLYYDIEISKSKIMNNFKKFKINGKSGIYNTNLITKEFKYEIPKADLKIIVIENTDEHKLFIDFFESDKDSWFGQNSTLTHKETPNGVKYIEYILNNVTAEEAKNFFKHFTEKTGKTLLDNYSVISYYHNKSINNVDNIAY